MTERYTWEWIKESWDVSAGVAAEQHAAESGHNGQFMLSGGTTVTCGHPACETRWGYQPTEQ